MRKRIGDKANRPAAAGIPALDIAIANVGGQGLFAMRLGVPNPTVSHWRTRTFSVPLEHVPAIVAIANDPRVTPYTLRPDFETQWTILAPQLVYGEVIRQCCESIERKHATDADEVAA
jgi:DNA-binding transcriptional regulator YdaS (Cro superfamily)